MCEKRKIEIGDYVFYNQDEEGSAWEIIGLCRDARDVIVQLVIKNPHGDIAMPSLDEIKAFIPGDEVQDVINNKKNNYYDSHYAAHEIQTVEMLQCVLTPEEFIGFLKGSMLKYRDRAGTKPGEATEKDHAKEKRYYQWLEDAKRGKTINPREK